MSHYAVAVFTKKGGKTVEELLAPYQENNMGDCPYEYMDFVESEQQDFSEEYEEHKEEYKTLDKFIEQYYGYEKNENGVYGYWENPNAKWDWYEEGGRFRNSLLSKEGEYSNSLRIKDIDFNEMKERIVKKLSNFWDNEKSDIIRIFNGVRQDDTKDSFIERNSEISYHSVIDTDGTWYEKGSMGWFGISSETESESAEWDNDFKKRFIDNMDEDTVMTIIDCHI